MIIGLILRDDAADTPETHAPTVREAINSLGIYPDTTGQSPALVS
jgi:hypothetical protein